MRKKTAKARSKRPAKRPARTPGPLVPQPHGGALWQGAPANPVPGPGRPKNEIRERLRNLAAGKGLDFLDALLDGKVHVQWVGACPHCKQESKPSDKDIERLEDRLEASIEQRLRANEQALKYGLGTQTEHLTPEEGLARLRRVLAVFGQVALDEWGQSREAIEGALQRMEEAWQGTEGGA